MKTITLETADDIQTVWSNWHGDVVVAITNGIQQSQAAGNEAVSTELSAVLDLIERTPVKASYSINTEVMEDNADIVIAIIHG